MLFPTEPASEYRERCLETQDGGLWLFEDLRSISVDFAGFIQRLCDKKDRAKIAPGRVPDFCVRQIKFDKI